MRYLKVGKLATILLGAMISATAAAASPNDQGIAKIFGRLIKHGEPGCSVGVVENGLLSHAHAFGMSDIARRVPLVTDSTFDIASVSKQFTAFALLLLQQQGELSLNDPIVKHLPELAASAQGVTLRHLLHHTGGLRDYIALIEMRGRGYDEGSTMYESMQALARQRRPNQAPGVEYEYSNTGYFLLGVVIARVSGQSLAEFSNERIFRPLGMVNTSIIDRYPDEHPEYARAYSRTDQGFEVDESGWEQVGDGGVHTNLHDLALWDENFYTGKVGGRELTAQMYEEGVLNSGEKIGYAAGLNITESRGLRWVTHGGSWAGFRSYLLRAPGEHFSVIVLCNREDADTGALARSVAELFLKDKLGPAKAHSDDDEETEVKPSAPGWQPSDLSRYVGAYFSPEAAAQCRLYLRNGRLVVEGCADGEVMKPGKPGEFSDEDESFTLRFPHDGTGNGSFIYGSPELRELPFTRIEEPAE